MPRVSTSFMAIIASLAVVGSSALAATPTPVATTSPSGGTPTIAPTATSSPAATQPAEATPSATEAVALATPAAQPLQLISTDGSLSGTIMEDSDGDGKVSAGDTPAAQTLVQLEVGVDTARALDTPPVAGIPSAVIDLYTEAGTFTFSDIPAGDYTLLIWWSPGFVNVKAIPSNPAVVWALVSVSADGSVRSSISTAVLVAKRGASPIPYPVVTGETAGSPPAVGVVNVRSALGRAPGVRLPATGTGAGGGFDARFWVLAGALVASVVLSVALARASRRRAG
ncbi:MAG: hypothetical protein HYX50_04110 [Chloroflexi bacterium]|nr:hypothetical protein [Chloroflexota bacterium]